MIINEKPWTRSKEVCKALQYNKKTADIIKAFCSKENFAHKYQLSEFPAAGNFMDWSKDSRKDDYYLNEEGMYEIVFLSQQPKAKDFRRHCFNVLFPSDKSHAMEIEDLTSRVQALEFTNETHQQIIKEKDATIALLNDDLKNREHDNVALQVQRGEYKDQLQKFQDIITILTPPRGMSFMSIPTTSRGYNDGSLTQKNDGLKHNIPMNWAIQTVFMPLTDLKRKGL